MADPNTLVTAVAAAVTALAAVVAAAATVYYAVLTKRLWSATDANVALTKKMLERDEEPMCSAADLKGQLLTDGRFTLEFNVKNAGKTPLQNVLLVPIWKGFDGFQREQCTNSEEWIGLLLPGEGSRKYYVMRLTGIEAFANGLQDVCLHIAIFLRFQSRSSKQYAHVLLCSCEFPRGFYVRKSFLAQEGDPSFRNPYGLLDDISATIHRSTNHPQT